MKRKKNSKQRMGQVMNFTAEMIKCYMSFVKRSTSESEDNSKGPFDEITTSGEVGGTMKSELTSEKVIHSHSLACLIFGGTFISGVHFGKLIVCGGKNETNFNFNK